MLAPIALTLLAQSPPVAVAPPPPPVYVLPPPVLGPAPPPAMAVIVRPPLARAAIQQLIFADDYPASARVRREEGSVGFTLAVGPDGRVHGCTITRSSGSAALDNATCMIMRRRARFTPAMDSNGMPAAASVAHEYHWRLPDRGQRG